MLVFSVGFPGSVDGPRVAGVGAGVTSGVGGGDDSGFCGKACSPASGVEVGDGARTCAQSGHAEIAAKHPSAIKSLLTGTNLLVGMLIQ